MPTRNERCARLTGLVFLLAASVWAAPAAPAPITVGRIEKEWSAGPVRGFWAKVRLDDPAVRVEVTAPIADRAGLPADTEAKLEAVDLWAKEHDLVLAVNAGFFGLMPGAAKSAPAAPAPTTPVNPGTPAAATGYRAGLPADIRGLSLSDGRVVSPPRVIQGRGDPALLITRDGRARVAYAQAADLADVAWGVAGIGPTDNGKEPGTLLLEDGKNLGATARVGPAVRHPRTGAGVSADGRTLILVAVDGRQKGYSVGVTLPELADLLRELGADDAVALDGGGSTSFYYRQSDGTLLTNRPSDGHWRAVANHLGFRLVTQP